MSSQFLCPVHLCHLSFCFPFPLFLPLSLSLSQYCAFVSCIMSCSFFFSSSLSLSALTDRKKHERQKKPEREGRSRPKSTMKSNKRHTLQAESWLESIFLAPFRCVEWPVVAWPWMSSNCVCILLEVIWFPSEVSCFHKTCKETAIRMQG